MTTLDEKVRFTEIKMNDGKTKLVNFACVNNKISYSTIMDDEFQQANLNKYL